MALTTQTLLPRLSGITVQPKGARPKFGRDALFERNDRYEQLSTAEQADAGSLAFRLKSLTTANEVRQAAGFLYNPLGRIRGQAAVKPALAAAQKEYDLLTAWGSKATDREKGLAGIKLANAKLAADVDDKQAFKLLDSSLQKLEQSGWNPAKDPVEPAVVHGYYNRGAYYMNNVIYKEVASLISPVELAASEVGHEGLSLIVSRWSSIPRKGPQALRDGLKDLETAVKLSRQLGGDYRLATAEYLTAQGEAYHFLSHLELDNRAFPPTTGRAYNAKGMAAFVDALTELTGGDKAKADGRFIKLADRLVKVKIHHMADHQHQGLAAAAFDALTNPGKTLIFCLQKLGILEPPKTVVERIVEEIESGATPPMLGFAKIALHLRGQQKP